MLEEAIEVNNKYEEAGETVYPPDEATEGKADNCEEAKTPSFRAPSVQKVLEILENVRHV